MLCKQSTPADNLKGGGDLSPGLDSSLQAATEQGDIFHSPAGSTLSLLSPEQLQLVRESSHQVRSVWPCTQHACLHATCLNKHTAVWRVRPSTGLPVSAGLLSTGTCTCRNH